ncbi:MAG: lytic transglycosylase domain-containing protein [Alphaproteobacteria bacterium]|nr:lytic transglycosylase domain-containing protein [Alphaproteobacteria bacterium]MDD9920342.1 lytic transglycosylase domain-containing protein [Alphaproteobacteria bacterium]
MLRFLLVLAAFMPVLAHTAELEPVLSQKDVTTYRKMFQLQKSLKRKEAAKLADEIENPILMGHVIVTRLMHPRTRTPYKDLQMWLSIYNDHPQAQEVYELANKRRPKGETHKSPAYGTATAARYTDLDTIPSKAAPAPQASHVRPKLIKRLKQNLRQQKYEESIRLLTQPSARVILGGEIWAKSAMKVSKPLLNLGRFTEVHHLMGMVSKYQTTVRPEALWLSGFAAYRAEYTEAAASAFRALTYATPKGSRAHSRAAWWSGRAYEKQGNTKLADAFFLMAAENPTTFYGQLGLESASKKHENVWKMPAMHKEDLAYLLEKTAVQRVIALAQVGEFSLAQNELKNIYQSLPRGMDETLLALSLKLHLPHMSFTLAHNLQGQGKTFLPGLYPVPSRWRPLEGYRVDPALLVAIMRQESAFDPEIVSRAGARGLMQIMPSTADDIRKRNKKFTLPTYFLQKPSVSLSLAQDYLQHLHPRFNGNLVHLLAAYNAGPGNLNKWISDPTMAATDPVVFIESIPYGETRNYVKRVLANLWHYRERFDQPSPSRLALSLHAWPRAIALVPSKKKES